MRKNYSWSAGRTDCPGKSGYTHTACSILSVLLMTAVFVLFADRAYSEHDIQTYTFEFTGSTGSLGNDMQEFTIHNDGALYFKLISYTPSVSGNTYTPRIGFMHLGQASCPARYNSFVDDPVLGTSYGPYYMEAEEYVSYFYLAGGGVDAYSLEIEYRRQLMPNDVEPNDTTTDARNIGALTTNSHITGHLGYLGCIHDRKDYIRFEIVESGDYLFDFQFDSPFKDKPECKLYFHLQDETSKTWLLNYLEGPQDASSLGPAFLDSNHTFLMSMESNSDCFDTIYEGGGSFVVNNKAGAYDIMLTRQQAPPADPFAITDLTVNPSTLWPGESLNGKVFIQNNTSSVSDEIELMLQVIRLTDNSQITSKQYTFYLAPQELKIVEFSLGELMAPEELTSLKGGKYKIVAVAQTRDPAGQITASSSKEVGFEITSGNKALVPIILFIKKEDSK